MNRFYQQHKEHQANANYDQPRKPKNRFINSHIGPEVELMGPLISDQLLYQCLGFSVIDDFAPIIA